MEASELRIGNLVEYQSISGNYVNDIPKWTLLEILSVDILGADEFPDHYRPIPITEEWLLKFAFTKINSTWYGHGNFRINISFDLEWAFNWMGISLNSVHQLQNLYFALTGIELKLK